MPTKPLSPSLSRYANPKKRLSPRHHCLVQSIISLSSQGHLSDAVSSLELLYRKGIRLPSTTVALLLRHCGNTKSLTDGKWVHLHLKLTGLKKPNTYLSNHLINMYFKCHDHVGALNVFDKMATKNLYTWNNMLSGYAQLGKIKPARRLFDRMEERDIVSWNTMLIAYARSGECMEAIRFYRELRGLGIGYNAFSFAGVLTVCVKLRELWLARQVHGQVLAVGFLSNIVISSSIVDAYAKCSEMSDARILFDEMPSRDVLAWTTLVSGYAQCGDMESAIEMFDVMPVKNPVSWTAMVAGFARNGLGHKALQLFTEMMVLCIRPDQFTFSSCLSACATIASLKHGKQIHGYLIRTNIKPNAIVVSSLIDMYSKCGSLEVGRRVFDLLGNKQNVMLWNTMISASAQHCHGEFAIRMFDDMVQSGAKPDRITLVVILNACSHSGLVQEGLRLFESMTCDHGIVPTQEHYACLIDLLGRAGCFDELMNLLKKMHYEPDDQVWNAFLGFYKIHGNIELGRAVSDPLIEFNPQSSAAYVLLSSLRAELGRWEMVEKERQLMDERHVSKEKAISWIEIENKVHAFSVSDRLHPFKEVIYSVLAQLARQMEEDGSSFDAER